MYFKLDTLKLVIIGGPLQVLANKWKTNFGTFSSLWNGWR